MIQNQQANKQDPALEYGSSVQRFTNSSQLESHSELVYQEGESENQFHQEQNNLQNDN